MEKRIMLAALDMDGTLLNSDHEVTPYTRAVMEHAVAQGRVLALCTGRCLSELRQYLNELPFVGYVIGQSGGWIYDVAGKKSIRQIVLEDSEVDAILTAAEGMDITWQVFIDNQSYMQFGRSRDWAHYHLSTFGGVFEATSLFIEDAPEKCRENRGRVSKINLYFADDTECRLYGERIAGRPLAVTGALGPGYEISPLGVSKAQGLELLCEYLGLSMDQTMAVGDGGNDLDVMGAAGLAVAMGNAIEAVRDLADVMTDDNDHDGVGHAIEKYMLNPEDCQ